MLCNNLSKILDPLKSRCTNIYVKHPSQIDMENVLYDISIKENFDIDIQKIREIIKSTDCLKAALWKLNMYCYNDINPIEKSAIDTIYDDIVKILLSNVDVAKKFKFARRDIYKIIITSISGTDIINNILKRIIIKMDDGDKIIGIIKYASDAEENFSIGRRDIFSIDLFISGVIKVIHS